MLLFDAEKRTKPPKLMILKFFSGMQEGFLKKRGSTPGEFIRAFFFLL